MTHDPFVRGPGDGDDKRAREGAGPPAAGDGDDVDTGGASRDRKERVLHTRVPAVLERELKRFAENLRVPVSNLVRTILEDAMSVADVAGENVEAHLRRAATQLEKERERLRKRIEHDPLEDVVAFQEVTLAVAATCAACGENLGKGAQAYLGVREEAGGPRVFVCGPCHRKA